MYRIPQLFPGSDVKFGNEIGSINTMSILKYVHKNKTYPRNIFFLTFLIHDQTNCICMLMLSARSSDIGTIYVFIAYTILG